MSAFNKLQFIFSIIHLLNVFYLEFMYVFLGTMKWRRFCNHRAGWKRCEKLLGCRLIKCVSNNYNKLMPLMCRSFFIIFKNCLFFTRRQGRFNVMYQLSINGRSFYDVSRFFLNKTLFSSTQITPIRFFLVSLEMKWLSHYRWMDFD